MYSSYRSIQKIINCIIGEELWTLREGFGWRNWILLSALLWVDMVRVYVMGKYCTNPYKPKLTGIKRMFGWVL